MLIVSFIPWTTIIYINVFTSSRPSLWLLFTIIFLFLCLLYYLLITGCQVQCALGKFPVFKSIFNCQILRKVYCEGKMMYKTWPSCVLLCQNRDIFLPVIFTFTSIREYVFYLPEKLQ